jgi:phage terminase small subunit
VGKVVKPKEKTRVKSMTDQMRAFAAEYTIDFNGKAAAIRAGYTEVSAASQACKLLAREDVQALIQQRMARIEKKTELSSERVLTEAWGIVTADVNELVEYRRRCCRHCYGIDYGYQRTVQEMSRDRAAFNAQRSKAIAKDPACAATYEDFDEQGGPGYDARKPPNPDCTNCWGDGVGDAYFKPTGGLTPAARALYAGVKQTKDGYQMLLIDKNPSMDKLFKHLGLYNADNKQKADGLAELLAAVNSRGAKLPIKG